jgi:integrase
MTSPISEKIVFALPTPESNKLHYFSGATLQGKKAPSGFAVRVTPAGSKAFVWFHRVNGKGHLETIGSWRGNAGGGSLSVYDAIVTAAERAKLVAKGIDNKGNDVNPLPARTRRRAEANGGAIRVVDDILDLFVERHVKKLRSEKLIAQTLDRLVRPSIGKIGIYDLKRSRVTAMLNEIADGSGEVMADRTLAYVRKAFNWYEVNGADDDFKSPIVRGMSRSNSKERERRRVLADDELRDLWAALDTIKEPACYPPYVRMLLLTGTRRTEAANMNASELDGEIWTIPADRYKTKVDHVIPLTETARELIGEKPAGAKKNSWFVFSTTNGEVPFSGFSKAKGELDKVIADIRKKAGREPMANWTLHDLRRTARSLMSRAGVPSDHAERCIGHVIGGVRGVYDRHAYLNEKRAAFDALALLLDKVIHPQSNVVMMHVRS